MRGNELYNNWDKLNLCTNKQLGYISRLRSYVSYILPILIITISIILYYDFYTTYLKEQIVLFHEEKILEGYWEGSHLIVVP